MISTNGQNLDGDRVLQALIEHPPTYLIVCLDGLTDETNSRLRVGAKLAPALDGVRELARMKRARGSEFPILHHRFIATRYNEHELPEVPDFAVRNRFDMLTVRTLSIIDAPEDSFIECKPSAEDLCAYGYRNGERIKRDDFTCEESFVHPAVFADGSVMGCEQDFNGEQSYGSMAGGASFKELWFGKRASEIRKKMRDNPERFSFCRNCPFKDRPVTDSSIRRYDLQKGL